MPSTDDAAKPNIRVIEAAQRYVHALRTPDEMAELQRLEAIREAAKGDEREAAWQAIHGFEKPIMDRVISAKNELEDAVYENCMDCYYSPREGRRLLMVLGFLVMLVGLAASLVCAAIPVISWHSVTALVCEGVAVAGLLILAGGSRLQW